MRRTRARSFASPRHEAPCAPVSRLGDEKIRWTLPSFPEKLRQLTAEAQRHRESQETKNAKQKRRELSPCPQSLDSQRLPGDFISSRLAPSLCALCLCGEWAPPHRTLSPQTPFIISVIAPA